MPSCCNTNSSSNAIPVSALSKLFKFLRKRIQLKRKLRSAKGVRAYKCSIFPPSSVSTNSTNHDSNAFCLSNSIEILAPASRIANRVACSTASSFANTFPSLFLRSDHRPAKYGSLEHHRESAIFYRCRIKIELETKGVKKPYFLIAILQACVFVIGLSEALPPHFSIATASSNIEPKRDEKIGVLFPKIYLPVSNFFRRLCVDEVKKRIWIVNIIRTGIFLS